MEHSEEPGRSGQENQEAEVCPGGEDTGLLGMETLRAGHSLAYWVQSIFSSSVPGNIKRDPITSNLQEKPNSAIDFLCDLGHVPCPLWASLFLLYSGCGGQMA